MIVSASKGNTVNFREAPNKDAKLICTIPIGTEVEQIAQPSSDWSQIRYNEKVGYMMSKFLKEGSGAITKSDLQRVYNSLAAALKTIEEVMK